LFTKFCLCPFGATGLQATVEIKRLKSNSIGEKNLQKLCIAFISTDFFSMFAHGVGIHFMRTLKKTNYENLVNVTEAVSKPN